MLRRSDSPPNPLEQLLFDPSRMALPDVNSSPQGAQEWTQLESNSSRLTHYELNLEQTKALEHAFKHKVSIIQGPPGTGKTKTAVSLAHLWALNNATQPKPEHTTVLYLGPSNQSVYVAAQALLKLPDVGTTSSKLKPRIKVTFAVRQEKVSCELRDGSWNYEAENHPRFKEELEALLKEADEILEGLRNLQGQKDANPLLDLEERIKDESTKLANCRIKRYQKMLLAKAQVLSETNIFLCTLSKWAYLLLRTMRRALQKLQPNRIIVDEAAQATEPESFLALAYGRNMRSEYLQTGTHLDHIVLVGDHMQLKPVVSNGLQSSQTQRPVLRREQACGFDRSLFARIATNDEVRRSKAFTMLTTQYRMHESICQLPSLLFYENRLHTDESVASRPHPYPLGLFPDFKSNTKFGVVAAHVDGRECRQLITNDTVSGSGTSFCNVEEAECVVRIVKFLDGFLADPQNGFIPSAKIPIVAIITPYRAMRLTLIEMLKACSFQYLKDDRAPIVGTVSAFQGGEADFVICSWVRSSMYSGVVSDRSHIGFLCDSAQINVAMTRARYGLVFVGNFKLLPIFHAFHSFRTYVKRSGTLVTDRRWPCQPSFPVDQTPETLAFVRKVLARQITPHDLDIRPTRRAVNFLNARTVLDGIPSDSHSLPLSTEPTVNQPEISNNSSSRKKGRRTCGFVPNHSKGPANASWESTSSGGLIVHKHRDGTLMSPLADANEPSAQLSNSSLPVWHHPSTFSGLVEHFSPPLDASSIELRMSSVLETLFGITEYRRLFPTQFRLHIVRSNFTIDFNEVIAYEFGLEEVLFTKGAAKLIHWCLYEWYEKRMESPWAQALQNSERILLTWQLAFDELNKYPETVGNAMWDRVRDNLRAAFKTNLDSIRIRHNGAVKSIQQDMVRLCPSMAECTSGFQCANIHICDWQLLKAPNRQLREDGTRPALVTPPFQLVPVPPPATVEDARKYLEEEFQRTNPNCAQQMPWQSIEVDDRDLFCAVYQGMLGANFAENRLDDIGNVVDQEIAQCDEETQPTRLRRFCYDFLEMVWARKETARLADSASELRTLLDVLNLNLDALFTYSQKVTPRDAAKLEILSLAVRLRVHIVIEFEGTTAFGYCPPDARDTIRLHCDAVGRYNLERQRLG